eukprot:gene14481-17085_t
MIMDEPPLTTGLNPPNDVENTIEQYSEGHYVKLTHGITFYQLLEATVGGKPRLIKSLAERSGKQSKIALCMHGLVWWSVTYHPYVQAMVDQGFTVLLFDFYGRGRSETPDIQYTLDAFLTQAIDLLDHLSIENVHLFGLSMGGSVAVNFAATHPQRIVKLCLLAPAIVPVPMRLGGKIVTMPYIGKLVFKLIGTKHLLLDLDSYPASFSDNINPKVVQDLVEKAKWQIYHKPGYLDAYHNTVYNVPFAAGLISLLPNIPTDIPIMILLGKKDAVIPYSAYDTLKQHLPQARVETIDCGHSISVEAPEETTKLIVAFLNE